MPMKSAEKLGTGSGTGSNMSATVSVPKERRSWEALKRALGSPKRLHMQKSLLFQFSKCLPRGEATFSECNSRSQ